VQPAALSSASEISGPAQIRSSMSACIGSSSAEDVVGLIQRMFEDIKDKKQLSKFGAAKRMRRGVAGALVDAVILQPKIGGIGFDLKKLFTGDKA